LTKAKNRKCCNYNCFFYIAIFRKLSGHTPYLSPGGLWPSTVLLYGTSDDHRPLCDHSESFHPCLSIFCSYHDDCALSQEHYVILLHHRKSCTECEYMISGGVNIWR
jgi:hypothetical protein